MTYRQVQLASANAYERWPENGVSFTPRVKSMNKNVTSTLLSTFVFLALLPVAVNGQEIYQNAGTWSSSSTSCSQCSLQNSTATNASSPIAYDAVQVSTSAVVQSCQSCNRNGSWQSESVYTTPINSSQAVMTYTSENPYPQPAVTYSPQPVSGIQYGYVQNSYSVPANTYSSSVAYPVNGSFQPTQTFTTNNRPGPVSRVATGLTNGLAQSKASRMAQLNLKGHLGGSLGNARYEGVGWSNVSSQSAIQACCYWGQKTPVEIGVARGADGFWYACVLYN